MKTLLLIRHAKSDWKDKNLADLERPLNQRGQRTAPLMGALLHEKGWMPQLILTSSAARARQTTELLAAKAEYTGNILYLNSLYLAEPSAIIGALSTLSDEFERVIVVGHNPGLECLVQILSRRFAALAPGSMAFISLPLQSWRDLHLDVEGELTELIVSVQENEEKAEERDPQEKKEDKKSAKKNKKGKKKNSQKDKKKSGKK